MKISVLALGGTFGCLTQNDERFEGLLSEIEPEDHEIFDFLTIDQIRELAEVRDRILANEHLFEDYELLTKFDFVPDFSSGISNAENYYSKMLRNIARMGIMDNAPGPIKEIVEKKLAKMTCPGDCWKINWASGECYIPEEQFMITCGENSIGISLDSCAFTKKQKSEFYPDEQTGVDFDQWTIKRHSHDVLTQTSFSDENKCGGKLNFDEHGEINAEWSLSEAVECGWTTDQFGQFILMRADLKFLSDYSGESKTVSRLVCSYDAMFEVSTSFNTEHHLPSLTGEHSSLAPSFDLKLVDHKDNARTSFVIGEKISVRAEYDYKRAGFPNYWNVPFKFFFEKCFVEREEVSYAKPLFLIGHPDFEEAAQCPSLVAKEMLQFAYGREIPAFQDEGSFSFDAFGFRRSENAFRITCTMALCAGHVCPDQICDVPFLPPNPVTPPVDTTTTEKTTTTTIYETPENPTTVPETTEGPIPSEMPELNATHVPDMPHMNATEIPEIHSTKFPDIIVTEVPELPHINATEIPDSPVSNTTNIIDLPILNTTEIIDLPMSNSTDIPVSNATEITDDSTLEPTANLTEIVV